MTQTENLRLAIHTCVVPLWFDLLSPDLGVLTLKHPNSTSGELSRLSYSQPPSAHKGAVHIHSLRGHSSLHMHVAWTGKSPLFIPIICFWKRWYLFRHTCLWSVRIPKCAIAFLSLLLSPDQRTLTHTQAFMTHRPRGWGWRTLTSQAVQGICTGPHWPAFTFLFLVWHDEKEFTLVCSLIF